jgi:hypothetical protein
MHKKSLSKNRKRKIQRKFIQLFQFKMDLIQNLIVRSQPPPKPPKLATGGLVSEIKPNIHPEPVTPFMHRLSVIHPEMLETLKAANPGETIIGYSNENGIIGVYLKPKPEIKSNTDHINNEQLKSALYKDFGKFVWPS